MTTISDVLSPDDRAKRNIKLATQALSDAFEEGRSEGYAEALTSHTCPDVESHSRVQAWNIIAQHPFFSDCYQTEGTLVDAMVAKLDAAHDHACGPAWRPVTREEIQAGWELRSRRSDGFEATWGIAYHRDSDGDWYTEAGRLLTFADAGWTVETTAAKTEPEPWDDDTLDEWEDALRATIDLDAGWATSTRAVLDRLAERGLIERAAIAGGEQS